MPELVGAVIVAAGSSSRMAGRDKIFASLLGRPLLAWAVDPFERCHAVDRIVLVLSRSNLDAGRRLVGKAGWSKVADVCLGGQRRQDSVKAGLERLGDCAWVLVHDGARPGVDVPLIERGLATAAATGAAIPAVPVKDTIKSVGADWLVRETLPRQELWAVQTPQVFRRDLLLKAHSLQDMDVTDDSMLLERLEHPVKVFPGTYQNMKVTTPDDLALVRCLLRERARAERQQAIR